MSPYILRYTFEKGSRLLKYNQCGDDRTADHRLHMPEAYAVESAKKSAGAPGVERVQVLDPDEEIIFDSAN